MRFLVRGSRSARYVGRATVLARLLLLPAVAGLAVPAALAQGRPDNAKPKATGPVLGLLLHEAKACPGYTLLAPSTSTSTYLIDMQGRVVRTWKSDYIPGLGAYLLENGHLLRTGQIPNPPFFGGGTGGRLQEFTWDGDLVWDFTYYSDKLLPNHDVCKLPNGNVLMIVWEKKTPAEALAAGRRPETVGKDHLLAGGLVEVRPTGKTTGEVVWEWHSWDHVVQDFDRKKAHYGDVAGHPELLDLNFGSSTIAAVVANPKELDKLRTLGYVGGGRRARPPQPDWLHINSVCYNAALDQVMLSVFEFNEIWVLDHSTTTAQAAGHTGGRHGKGGDLLYRWGNPRAYRAGTAKDQRLFGQHNAHWIEKGLPGEGHALVFNNGMGRRGGYSTVDEVVLPVDERGRYPHPPGKAFGPDQAAWSYAAPKKNTFYAPFISGAQRLANGNTLICSGTNGTVFEVTPKAEVVWKLVNPDRGSFGAGLPGFPAPPRPGEVLSPFVQGLLRLTREQKNQVAGLQKDVDTRLARILDDGQRKQLKARRGRPKGFPGGGLFAGFGPPGGGGLFRAPRYAADYPGLAGRKLQPGPTIQELVQRQAAAP
jgi:hypothetical protein